MISSVSLEEFLSRHLEALEADQAKHNLMLGLLNRAHKDPSKVRLWSLGEGAACAVQTPPHFIVLGDLHKQHAEILANALAGLDFNGCIGADPVPETFVAALAKNGVRLKLGMPQRIYTLQKQPTFPKAEGRGRLARSDDKQKYIDWVIQFSIEANPHQKPPSREELDKVAFDRPVFFWEVDGAVVAMASRTRETKAGSNISLVYTPEEFRGRGYGGSVTAFACEHAFAEGKKIAFLYTDLRNPTSNKIYQKIGFEPWCDARTYVRE